MGTRLVIGRLGLRHITAAGVYISVPVFIYAGSINDQDLVTVGIVFGAVMLGISNWLRARERRREGP
jgi:hypothetical protein